MVTCKVDSAQLIKMNRRSGSSMASTSSGFRLLDSDQNNNFDTISSISRNSIYKQKIDLMFDDSRFVYKYYSLVGRTCLGGLMSQMFQLKCREQRHNFRVHLPILVTVRRPPFRGLVGEGRRRARQTSNLTVRNLSKLLSLNLGCVSFNSG